MDVKQLGKVVDAEGKRLAKRLRQAGWSAAQAEEYFKDTTDAEPWVAIMYMEKWERQRNFRR